jgi:polysaccharide export outer membrane protein
MFPKANRNRKSYTSYIIIIIFITSSCVFPSCVTQRKVEYLQDKSKNIKAFDEAVFPDYTLKSNDELFIQISSLDEGATNIFSNTRNQSSGNSGIASPYEASLMSYTVDNKGYLLLPVIGNVFVKGRTLSQVNVILRDSLYHVLNQPIVSVKLINRYVSILGEVNHPGHYPYSQDKLSIYDAIGLAGDITDYGNRNNVILVRNENGENIRAHLKLSGSEILSSSFYYIRPNDLVYVKPLRNKFWGMRQFPFSLIFSTITTGLLIYNIFK